MKKFTYIKALLFTICLAASCSVAFAQQKETFSGTIVSYGSGFNTRVRTGEFKLYLNGFTPAEKADRYLGLLQDDGQDALLAGIRNDDLGRFSVGSQVGRVVNVAVEKEMNGKRRIYVVFERWLQFGELRGGYRSLDYPFGYIELDIDPATGKGDGTYIAAAKIRWKDDKSQVEVEDFATFPAKLLNVKTDRKVR